MEFERRGSTWAGARGERAG